jgi:hypothetical protein
MRTASASRLAISFMVPIIETLLLSLARRTAAKGPC